MEMNRRQAIGAAMSIGAGIEPSKFHHQGFKSTNQGIGFFVAIFVVGQGIFVYKPVPGAGNLVASIAAQAGTDPFGNAYQQGITSYLAGTPADFVKMLSDQILFGGIGFAQDGSVAAGGTETLTVSSPAITGHNQSLMTLTGGAGTFFGAQVALLTGQALVSAASSTAVTTSLLEVQGSLAVGTALGKIREFYPPSGGDDFAALNTALSSYGSADLLPGTYQLGTQLPVAGAALQGCGSATIIHPITGISGSMILLGNAGLVRGIEFFGGSTTRSANPAIDVLHASAGATRYRVESCEFRFCNGAIFTHAATATMHARFESLTGTNNASGITINPASAQSVQVVIDSPDLQQFEVGNGIDLINAQDVQIIAPNVAVQGAAGGIPLHVAGAAAAVYVTKPDLGQFPNTGANIPTTPTVLIEDSGGNSPNDILLTGGVLQRGVVGYRVTGAANRVRMEQTRIVFNQGAGIDDQGTGFGHQYIGCQLSSNGQVTGGGTAAEISVSGTAAVTIRDCRLDTPQGALTGQVASAMTFTGGGGTQIADDNWFGGANGANAFGTLPTYARRNFRYNPVGNRTIGVPASGSSTAPQEADAQVAIVTAGGNVAVSIAGSAFVTVPATTTMVFNVPAGTAVLLSYLVAPTWQWNVN